MKNTLLKFSFVFILIAFFTMLYASPVYAADGTGNTLTDVFYTEAFSGSWEVFSKFNWLGWLLQFIISAFCLIGLFLIAAQRLLTLLYLSSKPLFNKVSEAKQSVSDRRFLGLGGMFKDNFFESKNGIGLDAFIHFALTLMPDIKAYSDYADDNNYQYNLNDDDTVTTYVLKTAIPSIMLIFFFAIGFNGTLFKAYGNVVDALATVADDFVTTDLSAGVQRWVNAGTGFQFAYEDGTERGEFMQDLAESMYAKVLRKTQNLSTLNKQAIGSAINEKVATICGSSPSSPNINCTGWGESYKSLGDDAWSNLIYTIAINSDSKGSTYTYGWSGGSPLAFSNTFSLQSGGTDKKELYLHVIIQKKANSNETNYFKIKDGNSSGGGSSKQEADK